MLLSVHASQKTDQKSQLTFFFFCSKVEKEKIYIYIVYKFKNNNTSQQNCFIYGGQIRKQTARQLHMECCNRKRFVFVTTSLCLFISCTKHPTHTTSCCVCWVLTSLTVLGVDIFVTTNTGGFDQGLKKCSNCGLM